MANPDTGRVRLASLPPGQTAAVTSIDLDPADAKLLCAMGLCVGATIRLIRRGEPCVVAVSGISPHKCRCGGRCRIGVAKDLATRIMVRPA